VNEKEEAAAAALRASIQRRFELHNELANDLEKRSVVNAICALNIPFWFNHFVWTYDPRVATDPKMLATVPFDLFPRQYDLLDWITARVQAKEEGVCEKSRDIGWTWIAAGYALNRWLYVDGFKTTFGSRKEIYVDNAGDPDSIFGKIRLIMDRLPVWMMPKGFVQSKHDNFMRLINPANKNIISGEAGDNMGRGGRSTLYIVDEGAFIERAEKVNAAIVANADCRIWASSSNGPGNLFHQKRSSGKIPVFRYHYSDDPRKDAEYVKQKKKELESTPWTWEAEYEINYSASQSNVCIPAAWVASARKLYDLIASGQIQYDKPERGRAGLDIGAGKAKSVLMPSYGIIFEQPSRWLQVDNIKTTYDALDAALERSIDIINYDAVGVGNTVTSTLNYVPEKYQQLQINAVNTGVAPEERLMADKRMAAEWFDNLKIQLWWRGRDRFRATHEHILFLEGDTEHGVPHELWELIALCRCQELESQLSIPLWFKKENGLLILESKKQLAIRGVASPDDADAFMLNLAEPMPALVFGAI